MITQVADEFAATYGFERHWLDEAVSTMHRIYELHSEKRYSPGHAKRASELTAERCTEVVLQILKMRAAKEDEKEDEKEKAKEKESGRSDIRFKLAPMSQRGMAGSSAKKPRPHSTSSEARRGGGSSRSSSVPLARSADGRHKLR